MVPSDSRRKPPSCGPTKDIFPSSLMAHNGYIVPGTQRKNKLWY